MPFLDRTDELARISGRLRAREPAFLALYGRRRCGKSRLLREALRPGDVYYVADRQENALQIEELAARIGEVVEGFDIAGYPNWQALLKAFFIRAPRSATLVIDELPNLVVVDPSLPSVLQKMLDEGVGCNVVICGSSQRMMQGLVLDSSEPLYGRAEEIIKLEPLRAGWIQDALGVTGAKAVEAYAVWGGVPRYWEVAREHTSLWKACERSVFSRHGILYDEPRRVLADDLGDAAQPRSILHCIALGAHRLSEIASRLNKQASSLSAPMQNLVELGYIRREHPYGAHPNKTKQTLYKLADPFLQFWYTFVHPNHSALELDQVEPVMARCQKALPHHTSQVWETLCRTALPRLTIDGRQWLPGRRWWGKAAAPPASEIDIVAESIDGAALLVGEAKWEERTDWVGVHHKLVRSSAALGSLTRGKDLVYVIFAKKPTTKPSAGCIVVSPEEILSALR